MQNGYATTSELSLSPSHAMLGWSFLIQSKYAPLGPSMSVVLGKL